MDKMKAPNWLVRTMQAGDVRNVLGERPGGKWLGEVRTAAVLIDPDVQPPHRRLRERRLKRLGTFVPLLLEDILCAVRPRGEIVVTEGVGRYFLCDHEGIAWMPAAFYRSLGAVDEAKMFLLLDQGRESMYSTDLAYTAWKAGDIAHVWVVDQLAQAGLAPHWKRNGHTVGNQTRAITRFVPWYTHKRGKAIIKAAIQVMVTTKDRRGACDPEALRNAFAGMLCVYFDRNPPSGHQTGVTHLFTRMAVSTFRERAKRKYERSGSGFGVAIAGVKMLEDLCNR